MSRILRLTLLCIVVATAWVVAATPPVQLDIRLPMGNAPLTVNVRVTVAPHEGNRELCVQWQQVQGGGQFRRSCVPWVSDTAPVTHWHRIKDLSSGRWEVIAFVIRNDEKAYVSNPITLHSLGPNYESEPEL
jgi:hypothetical protein